jgi:hypothetical protein
VKTNLKYFNKSSAAKGGAEFAFLGSRQQLILKTINQFRLNSIFHFFKKFFIFFFRKEKSILKQMIPSYLNHLAQHPTSLLPRYLIFGCLKVCKLMNEEKLVFWGSRIMFILLFYILSFLIFIFSYFHIFHYLIVKSPIVPKESQTFCDILQFVLRLAITYE